MLVDINKYKASYRSPFERKEKHVYIFLSPKDKVDLNLDMFFGAMEPRFD